MDFMRLVGLRLMGAISKALGAGAACLDAHFAKNPTELFRIFSYPSPREEEGDAEVFGVGEHTDYGFLTLLYQDQTGGLQVKIPSEDRSGFQWIEVPFIPGTHVVNLGDALEHYTHGRFKATPHRVIYHGRRATGKPRLSFPYFFDPCWGAPMTPMTPIAPLPSEGLKTNPLDTRGKKSARRMSLIPGELHLPRGGKNLERRLNEGSTTRIK